MVKKQPVFFANGNDKVGAVEVTKATVMYVPDDGRYRVAHTKAEMRALLHTAWLYEDRSELESDLNKMFPKEEKG